MTSTILESANPNVKIHLLPIDELKPHEQGSPLYLELLKKEIFRDGMLKYPIIADERTHVILDGMHRWLALKSLGYTLIPAILVDSFQRAKIRIGRRRIHRYVNDSNDQITIGMVIATGLSGNLMKPRTTRHFFPFPKPQQINYPLQLLNKRTSQDVSEYLTTMTREECNMLLEEWLDEIHEELEFLEKRKEEVEKEKEELLNRLKLNGNNSSC